MSYDDENDDTEEVEDTSTNGGSDDYWGFASYDVDSEDEDNPTIIYTRHERSGRVNQYPDNGDGGHGHFSWKNEDDYENGDSPEYSRKESNDSSNPSQSEVQERSGCYLTSACMQHFKSEFDDNCYELTVLRWFRDNYVTKEDIKLYYKLAPKIVEGINKDNRKYEIYDYIYDTIVDECVTAIENGDYEYAYKRYKESILSLKRNFVIDNTKDLKL